jgi:uncharacterized protein
MAHHNRVAEGLALNPPEYEAILGIDPNSDDTLWEPWISGFERAMRLRPDVWESTLESEDEEVRATIPIILALHEIDVGTSTLGDEGVDEFDEIAPDLIPGMVLTLNEWAKGQTAVHTGRMLMPSSRRRRRSGGTSLAPAAQGGSSRSAALR